MKLLQNQFVEIAERKEEDYLFSTLQHRFVAFGVYFVHGEVNFSLEKATFRSYLEWVPLVLL